jgi:hypothetical protein
MGDVKINSAKLQAQVSAYAREAARRGANRVALRARASVLGQGRIDTHEMIRGFKVIDVTTNPKRPTYRVLNVAPHFKYQELGTPRSAPGVGFIYPKRAQYLRFRPKGSNTFVFARRVRGVKPGHFLKRAAAATKLKDFTDGPLTFT